MTKKNSTLKDIYNEYPHKDDLTWQEFSQACKAFNHLLSVSMIEGGIVYKLPARLGVISIRKNKNKKKFYIDFKHFNSTGEIVKLRNKHSEGYYARFHWEKQAPFGVFKNKPLFKFRPSRFNARYLAKCIKEKNTINKYYEHK